MVIKINIGCGNTNFGAGWDHIDSIDDLHIKSDNIFLKDYRDNSIDIIYASHFIEYFDRDVVIGLLEIWKTKLKKGGILKLAVPDFRVICKLYLGHSHTGIDGVRLQEFLGPLYGKMECNEKIIYHKTVYDYTSLAGLLETLGFKDVKRWDWKNIEYSHIDDCSQSYLLPRGDKENGTLISLNIQCIK